LLFALISCHIFFNEKEFLLPENHQKRGTSTIFQTIPYKIASSDRFKPHFRCNTGKAAILDEKAFFSKAKAAICSRYEAFLLPLHYLLKMRLWI